MSTGINATSLFLWDLARHSRGVSIPTVSKYLLPVKKVECELVRADVGMMRDALSFYASAYSSISAKAGEYKEKLLSHAAVAISTNG